MQQFYRMEIDFEEIKISFTTFEYAKSWVEIALSAGAEIVTIWYGDRVMGAYS